MEIVIRHVFPILFLTAQVRNMKVDDQTKIPFHLKASAQRISSHKNKVYSILNELIFNLNRLTLKFKMFYFFTGIFCRRIRFTKKIHQGIGEKKKKFKISFSVVM